MKAKIKVTDDGDVKAFELPGLAIVRPKSSVASIAPELDEFLDKVALVYEVLDSNPEEAKEAIRRYQVIHGS